MEEAEAGGQREGGVVPEIQPNRLDLESLRQLEREIAPIADAHRTRQPSGLLRAALPTAFGAAALAIALLAWPHREGEVRPTDGATTAGPIDEEARARIEEANAATQEAERILRAEFAKARGTPHVFLHWYEDLEMLNYRSPWGTR